ncbi:MAG: peptide chain release factor 1 [Saprospiraceae bacterium]
MANYLEKLSAIHDRFLYVEEALGNPDIVGDMERFAGLNKEYKELKALVEVYFEYRNLLGNIATAKNALSDPDPDMREMAKEELDTLQPQLLENEEKIKFLLIPKDPEDSKDVVFEIRSGTGGDEASLFAGDLFRMYARYFSKQGWRTETILVTEGTAGGYSKLVLEVSGNDVYGTMKFESGAHRVQRIPDTESKGRVHTSAATVAVIPKFEEKEINIRPEDLKVDVFRASGAGGQHVNRTESAVRITHLPTGLVQECQDGRSQIQNREIALTRLYQKIVEQERERVQNEFAAQRRSLVGSGDRSEKIRTYNWPQNRVTDHRLEGDIKNFNLDKVIEGELEELLDALRLAEYATKLVETENE